jgi:cysteinyl-tRNA synthetase
MAIFIQNSLTKKKEEFIPLTPQKVNIYSCGVTVYDDCHIGHARSLYIFEVIRRYLAYRGFRVNFVRNITDIDDKIINRANELKVKWDELVAKYIARYYEDLKALGLEKADFEPRATENIPEMIKFIQGLIDKGYAYPTSTGVYFSVRKFEPYGKLSGQGIEQMLTGVRKDADETKEDPLDFALWKSSKPGEPFWESPWGNGRPGWHIECSVMSTKYLKTQTLDIHAGGRDLIFPHHENEIAQAEALTGKPFAKYWIHHGLLTIDGQKMSKSLGNFITIKDALSNYHPDALKIFFLQSHYSSPIDFSAKRMEEATKWYKSFVYLFTQIQSLQPKFFDLTVANDLKKLDEIDSHRLEFEKAMDNDFNTPQAMVALEKIKSYCQSLIVSELISANAAKIKYAIKIIIELLNIFVLEPDKVDPLKDARLATDTGLRENFQKVLADSHDEEWARTKQKEREQAKKEKNYAEADKLRKELEDSGYILLDKKDGSSELRRK